MREEREFLFGSTSPDSRDQGYRLHGVIDVSTSDCLSALVAYCSWSQTAVSSGPTEREERLKQQWSPEKNESVP